MKRKLSILMSLFIFLSFLNINVYAVAPDDEPQVIKVKLNGKTLEFDTDPIIENDRTMVPMRTIFEHLGAKVDWHEEIQTVTGYRRYKDISDVFIKLKIGDKIAYRNGNSFTLDSPPIIRDDRTLVPVRFISQSFGFAVKWDDKNRTVLLSSDDDNVKEPKLIDDISYISKYFDPGVNVMIPEYWDSSDDSNKFGYKDDENSIQMLVNIEEFEALKGLDQFTEENKSAILDNYKDKVVFTGSDKLTINNIDVNIVYLKNSAVTPEINQVVYYFISSNYGYSVTFSYHSKSNDSQLLTMISNIINTIEVNGVISTQGEHYIEYNAFFDYGITLSSEISPTMEVHNEFDFKGTTKEDSGLEYFVITVSKKNDKSNKIESCRFKIPIMNNEFDSKLYTPFELGKHNIDIMTNESNDNNRIMQFSVLNYSAQNIRYIIPSLFVEKDDVDIVALAKEIGEGVDKKYLNDSHKAKAIFEWIYENIEYEPEAVSQSLRSAKMVLTDKKGSNEEISYLYTALLRASNIPTKIRKGKLQEAYHTWNEILINGKWIIADPTWGSGYVDDENVIKKLNLDYFNINKTIYENKFTDITTLEH
jgi:hypothetical protein